MGSPVNVNDLGRSSDWSNVNVTVLGLGIAGYAAADNLAFLGAKVTALDESSSSSLEDKRGLLEFLEVSVILGQEFEIPPVCDLVIVSPGIHPAHKSIRQALEREIAVWGELELAWRLRGEDAADWLCITGTNGKTTTTLMLESMLRASGLRSTAAGNIGHSLVEVVMDPAGYDVIAVEVGAPQLPYVYSMEPFASVCLNLAEDHIDLFGDFQSYRDAKARIYERTQFVAVYNAQDEQTITMLEEADVREGCRAIGFSLTTPDRSEVGIVEDFIVDRAFVENRDTHALEICKVNDIKPAGIHNVANALAAIALARSYGVSAQSIQKGLEQFRPAPHRVSLVREVNGVKYINDSKATNAHAAKTSILSFDNVIWIAGGDSKDQDFSELVQSVGKYLKSAILVGRDQQRIAAALEKYAPNVTRFSFPGVELENFKEAIEKASEIAIAGDVILLAPACASWDMFENYAHRGQVFEEVVRGL
ncbi:MAG: hypothetical protein RIS09_698 [Actinomycetota bacterium]|jgi:UDP-N-acetylmuramoylalanine--D-glutamate ligase